MRVERGVRAWEEIACKWSTRAQVSPSSGGAADQRGAGPHIVNPPVMSFYSTGETFETTVSASRARSRTNVRMLCVLRVHHGGGLYTHTLWSNVRMLCVERVYACYVNNYDPLWRTRPRVANHSVGGGAVGSVCSEWAPRRARPDDRPQGAQPLPGTMCQPI